MDRVTDEVTAYLTLRESSRARTGVHNAVFLILFYTSTWIDADNEFDRVAAG